MLSGRTAFSLSHPWVKALISLKKFKAAGSCLWKRAVHLLVLKRPPEVVLLIHQSLAVFTGSLVLLFKSPFHVPLHHWTLTCEHWKAIEAQEVKMQVIDSTLP